MDPRTQFEIDESVNQKRPSASSKKSTKGWWLMLACGLAAAIVLPNLPAKDRCKDDLTALVMAQDWVEKNLKSPSTAQFPSAGDPDNKVTRLTGCKFRVEGYVDAQNGFGAMIRSQYSVIVYPISDTGNWHRTDLVIY